MIESIEKDGKKLLKYSWQPKLEDGTPIGGMQVAEAETVEALNDKIADSYNHLYRRNRELMREKELSTTKPPDGAELATPKLKLKPRNLTPAERMQVSRDINDPEKIESAVDLMLEARFGGRPADVASTVQTNSESAETVEAREQAIAWAEAHPEFHHSAKNASDLTTWIHARGLKFTYANFQKAFEALSPALETAPPSAPETQLKPTETQTPSRIAGADESGAQPQPKIPSPVTRRQASGSGEAKREGLTAEQIRRMPTAEYRKKLLSDPEFVKQVNNLNFAPAR